MRNTYYIQPSHIVAVAISLLLLGLGIFKVYVGAQYAALGFFILIPCVWFTAISGIDFWFDHVIKTGSVIALTITSISMIAVVETSPVFDRNYQDKNFDLFREALYRAKCQNQPNEQRRAIWHKLKDQLMVMCVSQGHFDMLNLGFDLAKAAKLDPISSTIDSINNDFFREKTITCQDIARQMEAICPNSLMSLRSLN
ncbi:hypothetical protein ACE02U_09035 [Shewanella xiamenensis]